MKYIKRILSFVLLAALLLLTASCGSAYISNDEEKAFEELLPKLFGALDSSDEAAIYELFSPTVRAQSHNLQEQISELIAVYGGPTDEFELDSVAIQGTGHIGEPGNWEGADATIPVRSGENYYFFDIDLMYEHYDEKQVGIVQLDFYTADEMLARREENGTWIEQEGLHIHAEKHLACEIRTISRYPVRYTPSNSTINVEQVKKFLKTSCSFTEFVEKFGEPNAKSSVVDYYYYELPRENEDPRYLQIFQHEGEVLSVTIVDDFKFIETVWKKE